MSRRVFYSTLETPIGTLLLTSDGEELTRVSMGPRERWPVEEQWLRDDRGLAEARRQLDAYFHGRRRTFDLPLRLEGTPFQRRIWEALREVPFGETVGYAELGRCAGRAGAARAVGGAVGRNPLAIVVPCHRVVGSDGSLVGFGGGLERKRRLLEHEGATGVPGGKRGKRAAAVRGVEGG